jgi:hypothetical protein
VNIVLKAVRILAATAVAVLVLREFGLIAVGLLAVAVQLATMLIRRLRSHPR